MAFNKNTGLVYIPAMLNRAPYSTAANFEFKGGSQWHMGQADENDMQSMLLSIPPGFLDAVMRRLAKGKLIAWDPVAQKEVWSVMHETMWNGGVLTTASDLVFQGTGDGRFIAYDATDGNQLWETPTTTGVIAPPISYEVDGEQYIALMAGWGGAGPLSLKLPGSKASGNGHLLVYKLGGTASLPEPSPRLVMPEPPEQTGTDDTIAQGAALYQSHCFQCHGAALSSSGVIADLRYLSRGSHEAFQQIVRGGILSGLGMASFADRLSEAEVEAIHDYVIYGAHQKWEEDHASDWWQSIRDWSYDLMAEFVAELGLI